MLILDDDGTLRRPQMKDGAVGGLPHDFPRGMTE